jgi:hypothetical protein
MFKSDQISSLFNCAFCSKVLHDPITLPCGNTVCKIHSSEISQDKCFLCNKNHSVPEDGFQINTLIQEQLNAQLHTLNHNFSQFNESRKIIDALNKEFNEIESIHKDPENYISEHCYELNRQVDLKRETMIKDIHEHSDSLIQKIALLKKNVWRNQS